MSEKQLEQLIEIAPETLEESASSAETKKSRTVKSKKEPLPETSVHFTIFQGKKSSLSMQYPQGFVLKGRLFKTVEQYLFYKKAILFNDLDSAQRIFESDSTAEQKKLASQVKEVDKYRWDKHSLEYLYEANRAKFAQSQSLREDLFATRGTLIVEASPTDKHWGCGLSSNNTDIYFPKTWPGDNLMGKSLTTLREDLYSGLEMNKIIEETIDKYIAEIVNDGNLPDDMGEVIQKFSSIMEEVIQHRQSDNPYERWKINTDSVPEPIHITVEHETDDFLAIGDLNMRAKMPQPAKVIRAKGEKIKETSEEKRERKPEDYQFILPEKKFVRTYPITLMLMHTMENNAVDNQIAYWRDIQDIEEAFGMRSRQWQKGYHLAITNDGLYVNSEGAPIHSFGTQKERGRVAGTLTMKLEDTDHNVSLRGTYPTDKWNKRAHLFFLLQQVLPIGWR